MQKRSGLTVESKSLELDDLVNADEAFFTGTAAEVTPIRELDGALIGNGKRGPITEQIQKTFFDAVGGKDERFSHWLHLVETTVAA